MESGILFQPVHHVLQLAAAEHVLQYCLSFATKFLADQVVHFIKIKVGIFFEELLDPIADNTLIHLASPNGGDCLIDNSHSLSQSFNVSFAENLALSKSSLHS